MMPEGHSADAFRKAVLTNFNMSLGQGLSKLSDKVFRIGHLGDFNDLTLCGTLSGVEMGLKKAGVPHRSGGVQAALDYLAQTSQPQPTQDRRSEEHTSELQSLMRISYAVFCLQNKNR